MVDVSDETYVYIDALNFYYGAVKGTAHKWVDFEALTRLLVPRDSIGRIKYFTARIKPFAPEDRAHERQNAFLRAIDANPRIEIVYGYFRRDVRWRALAETHFGASELFRPELRPQWLLSWMLDRASTRRTLPATVVRVESPEEKGSDVNIGTHLIYDVLKGHCSKALVVTNDSDLCEPIRLAVREGVEVGIVNPHRKNPTNGKLRKAASFEIPLRPDTIAECQMPNVVTTAKGREVHKPREWR